MRVCPLADVRTGLTAHCAACRQAEISSHLRQGPLLATFRESEEVQGDPLGDASDPISRRSSQGGDPPAQWSPRSSPTRTPLRSPSKLSRTPLKLTRWGC